MSIFGTVAKIGKGVLGAVAPTLAGALPGPVGDIARKAVTGALGLDHEADELEIKKALATASPETLLKLKEADVAFKTQMKQLGVDLAKVDAGDRASAREREVALKDWATRTLAFVTVAGWFGFTYALFKWTIPSESHDLLLASFGILSTAVVGIFNYYFGSSQGSARKTELMNGK